MRASVVLVTILLAVALTPALADEAKVVPMHHPLGPDATRFFFSLPRTADKENDCRTQINEPHGVDVNAYWLYATNNAADPCRLLREPDYGQAPHASSLLDPIGSTHVVLLHPVAERYLLKQGEPMAGTLVIVADRVSLFVPHLVLKTVTLDSEGESHETVVAEWNASGPLSGTAVTSGDPAANDTYTWEFELGPAPARLEGSVRLEVNLTRGIDQVRAMSGITYRIGTHGEIQSHLDLPLDMVPLPPPHDTPEVSPSIICPDGKEATTGTCPVDRPAPSTPPTDDPQGPEASTPPPNATVHLNGTPTPRDHRALPGPAAAFVVVALLLASACLRRVRTDRKVPRVAPDVY